MLENNSGRWNWKALERDDYIVWRKTKWENAALANPERTGIFTSERNAQAADVHC